MHTITHHTHHARAHTHMHLDDVHLSLSLWVTHTFISISSSHTTNPSASNLLATVTTTSWLSRPSASLPRLCERKM